MTAVLTIDHLDFTYPKNSFKTLHDITISVNEGEFIVIFGPNGGGKTTFLKLLMGFLRPDRGKIALFGQDPIEARTLMGYVPQNSEFDALFPITTMELVLMGALSKLTWYGTYPADVKKQAKEILYKVGLSHKEAQAFGTLSGGEKQRALIARALLSNPKLLILDEPTANLDPFHENEIYNLLLSLKKSLTILMVSHDLNASLKRADRLFCIHRNLCSYNPSDICEHFAHGLYHKPLPS